jgi:hypothetical protein
LLLQLVLIVTYSLPKDNQRKIQSQANKPHTTFSNTGNVETKRVATEPHVSLETPNSDLTASSVGKEKDLS